jgi:hypothetical protein
MPNDAPQPSGTRIGRGSGGARPGAGRKPLDHEYIIMRVSRNVRVRLYRAANHFGTRKFPTGSAFWNSVFKQMLNRINTEPKCDRNQIGK